MSIVIPILLIFQHVCSCGYMLYGRSIASHSAVCCSASFQLRQRRRSLWAKFYIRYQVGCTSVNLISATHISVGPLSICIPFGIRPQEFFTFWIPIITFEVVLFAMVAYRGIQAQISDNSLFRSGQSLLKVLLRDSVVYFVL